MMPCIGAGRDSFGNGEMAEKIDQSDYKVLNWKHNKLNWMKEEMKTKKGLCIRFNSGLTNTYLYIAEENLRIFLIRKYSCHLHDYLLINSIESS